MLDLGKLADVFAGESAAAFSPATRGVAEGDSADGEVSVYLGQLEQVYETSLQPLYETDEDGEPVYSFNDETGEDELVPLLDEDGQPMYAEQPLLDEDGQPVPVLDDLGNPVYEKVQLVDADGGAIVEYDEDGRPVAAVDEHGETIYLLDEDGEKIPELDDAGEIVYERDPETGEDVLDGEGNRIPVWQVQAVEEAQVATLEAVGCVSAGDTPVVSMGFDSAAVMGSAGWGDALRRTTGDLSAMIREYGDGVLVCREGNDVGALVNADGSFDVVTVEWDDDGVPTAGSRHSTFGQNGAVIGGGSTSRVSVSPSGMTIIDESGALVAEIGLSGQDVDGRVSIPVSLSYLRKDEQSGFNVYAIDVDVSGAYAGSSISVALQESVGSSTGAWVRGISFVEGTSGNASRGVDAQTYTYGYDVTYDADNGRIHIETRSSMLWPPVWGARSYNAVVDYDTSSYNAPAFTFGTRSAGYVEGAYSMATGQGLVASEERQIVLGMYNEESNSVLVIGAGYDEEHRQNVFEVSGAGDVAAAGDVVDGHGTSLTGHHHDITEIDNVESSLVTGVKGAAEDSYRKGDVEIDEGDIGLGRLGETDIDAIIQLAG